MPVFKKRKYKEGASATYISRDRALKKLHVTPADFRRLCILKGVYPHDPKNQKRANHGDKMPTTMYYVKDIEHLIHEPILKTMRAHRSHMRRLAKAIGRGEYSDAKRIMNSAPTLSLSHIIRQRYPVFIDALRDLDDALSTICLFASLPSTDVENVSSEMIQNCAKISLEFQHYVMRNHAVRKTFLSAKGIYYQAEIMGVSVTWSTPYGFAQVVPEDVDLEILGTFLEFYTKFVQFVLFKLYSDAGLVYPPKWDEKLDEEGNAGLAAFEIQETADSNLTQLLPDVRKPDNSKRSRSQVAKLSQSLEKIAEADRQADETEQELHIDGTENKQDIEEEDQLDDEALFKDCHFFVAREVPVMSLIFVLTSHSAASVSYPPTVSSSSPFEQSDQRITHEIVDRPEIKARYPNRTYVQPQWVYDCINAGELLDTANYVVGATLPPHLSPFEQPDAYDPNEPVSENENEQDDEFTGFEEVNEEVEHVEEIKAELAGKPVKNEPRRNTQKLKKHQAAKRKAADDKELKDLAIGMMTKSSKRRYDELKAPEDAKANEKKRLRERKKQLANKKGSN